MEIIVRGRHITVPPRFRQHAADKLARLGKLDQKAIRIDVEVSEERNPRQSDRRERVELTVRSRGPAIRAEAAADEVDPGVACDSLEPASEARGRFAPVRLHGGHQLDQHLLGDVVGIGELCSLLQAPGVDHRLVLLHELVPRARIGKIALHAHHQG